MHKKVALVRKILDFGRQGCVAPRDDGVFGLPAWQRRDFGGTEGYATAAVY
jgi:hypothetical protein